MRNLIVVAVLLFVVGCAAQYRSETLVDPMTGEMVRTVRNVRMVPVEGHTSFGREFLTGSSVGISMSEARVGPSWMTFSIGYVSSYSGGFIGAGQQASCVDDVVRMSLDGEVVTIDASGAVRERGMVTGRTFGQATSGVGTVSQSFTVDGDAHQAFMRAGRVVVEYCEVVSELAPESLAELQGRTMP